MAGTVASVLLSRLIFYHFGTKTSALPKRYFCDESYTIFITNTAQKKGDTISS